jgi:Mg/Co/Ni transporter MgtE
MSTEKKWKRGDIGPDGMVFWQYGEQYQNGERWIDADKYKQLYEKKIEQLRRWNQENREKAAEDKRRYRQENREKLAEAARRYQQENREKLAEAKRRWQQENRENILESLRRKNLKKRLQKSSPKTISEFYASLTQPHQTIAAILALTPDEGQTLAQLIHELSGYPMELCEQIANPPEPEPETEPTPEPQPKPAILPDLF